MSLARVVTTVLLGHAWACSSEPARVDSGGADAPLPDGGVDLADDLTDLAVPMDMPDDAAPQDFGQDAFDAAVDGGCGPLPECTVAVGAGCEGTPVVDGTSCASITGGICVAGTCVARSGCGDGYREPGPDPAREACDDGNVVDGDLCSSTCVPTAEHVPGPSRGTDVPSLRAVDAATDGLGQVLVVWASTDLAGVLSVAARRYDALGAPAEPAPGYLTVHTGETTGTFLQPNVAGLPHGGWAVAYAAYAGPTLRIVREDGTMGGEADLDADIVSSGIRVAALGDGTIVAVWAKVSPPSGTDPLEGVLAQVFDESGSSRGAAFTVPFDTSKRERLPMVAAAAAGDEWIAVWQQDPLSALDPTPAAVRGRRFSGSTASDHGDVTLVPVGNAPFITALHDHDYALAWTVNGGTQDVHSRVLRGASPGYDVADDVGVGATAANDTSASVASAGGDEYVVGWHTDSGRIHTDFAVTSGLTLTAEAMMLEAHLQTVSAGEIGVAPARDRGIYVVWSERRADRVTGDPLEDVMVQYVPLD